MSRLQAVDLTPHQIRVVKKAYSDGELDTRVLFNLLNNMAPAPVRGLELLTVPPLSPSHFNFTGNRTYRMQLVSNGDCCALLSQEKMSRKEEAGMVISHARMEVIDHTHLPFLKVARPTDMQVRQLYADYLEWAVEGFNSLKASWTPEALEVALSLSAMNHTTGKAERDRILAGEDPRDVLKDWVQGQDMAHAPTRRSPRP